MELSFKKFEIVTLNWGYNISCIKKSSYTKEEIINFIAINYGSEFSDIDMNCNRNFHMGLIVSSYFFNKNNKSVLVAPITSLTKTDKEEHLNKFILHKENYKGLKNDSVVILNKLREIDKNRIKKHLFFIKESHKGILNNRIKKVFEI